MRILINGCGIAGPTLAFWLQRLGHEVVLLEKAPALREGGYLIDFWGHGYTVAERMGILPELREKGYRIRELRMVDRKGRAAASMDLGAVLEGMDDRLLSIARGDIATTIHRACQGVETRFGTSIVGIEDDRAGARVTLSDGSQEDCDLVVGADGLLSAVRAIAFGPQSQYEKPLGCHVAALRLPGYRPREAGIYLGHTVPGRQAMRVSLRDDDTLALFVFRSELLDAEPQSAGERKAALQQIFGGMGWEVPNMLRRLDAVEDLYFDRVSQIRMDSWTRGRVMLVGDAAACVSLLAGEGTGLAMTEAYVLATALHRAGGDHTRASWTYESTLRRFVAGKQRSAKGFIGFFAPRTKKGMQLRDLLIRVAGVRPIARHLIARTFRDSVALPSDLG